MHTPSVRDAPDPADLLAGVVAVAREAGSVAMEMYGKVSRLTKTHAATTAEAVTEADRATQRKIVSLLRERFPPAGIIGEESDEGAGITADDLDPAGDTWVIDPIDGTNNYVAGLGNWAVCIGLLRRGVPVLGVVYDVTRDVAYAGADGKAYIDSVPVRALTSPLSESSVIMLTSNLLGRDGRCPAWAIRWIGQTDWKIRMLGSAALEAVMVGAGVAHGAVTVNGKLWDAVAPAAFCLAAGADVTKLDGAALWPFDVTDYAGAKVPFLAAGPGAREALVTEIARHP